MSAILARAPRLAARPVERRRHQRVTVALLGRYMLSDRQEYPCQTVDISPGGALVVAPVRGQIGERVIAYLEHIASQLTWLANRQTLGLPEDRRHERIVPRAPAVVLRLESGREFEGRLIDVSLSGAGITLDGSKPAIGTSLSVGSTYSKVVRHFQGGIAVEFKLALSPDRLDENIIL
jgi:c-di-GMP-binding flagellar brake protein YcgR